MSRNNEFHNGYFDPRGPLPCNGCAQRKTCLQEALECEDFKTYYATGQIKNRERIPKPIAANNIAAEKIRLSGFECGIA